jgi:hypothetical protein
VVEEFCLVLVCVIGGGGRRHCVHLNKVIAGLYYRIDNVKEMCKIGWNFSSYQWLSRGC